MFALFRTFLIVLLLIVLARALLRFFGGVVQGATSRPAGGTRRAAPAPTKMVQDPICGTYVVPAKALVVSRGKDSAFFCSEACRAKYLERS